MPTLLISERERDLLARLVDGAATFATAAAIPTGFEGDHHDVIALCRGLAPRLATSPSPEEG
jgi:hypothetical protein